ncbi:MAG: hypothetical protein HYX69_03140 [Planctomycetia bacterium]|nr:hypothetical protein [Planctomycetia bacterium]
MADAQHNGRRRWFRYSLRTLLALVLVVAIPLAWVAKERNQSRHELQTAKELESRGVTRIDFGGPYDPYGKAQPHAWWRNVARRVLGERIFAIYTDRETPGVDSLTSLAGLTNLRSVWLLHAPVPDLTPLAGLTSLEYLYLYGSMQVSDLTPLAGLANLKTLDLRGSKVRDLAPLSGLSKLVELDVRFTAVSRGQVEALQKALPHCEIRHDPFP